jgi:hypothetical protein
MGPSVTAGVIAMLALLVPAVALGGRRWWRRRRLAALVAVRLRALGRDIPAHPDASERAPAAPGTVGSGVTLGVGPPPPS